MVLNARHEIEESSARGGSQFRLSAVEAMLPEISVDVGGGEKGSVDLESGGSRYSTAEGSSAEAAT